MEDKEIAFCANCGKTFPDPFFVERVGTDPTKMLKNMECPVCSHMGPFLTAPKSVYEKMKFTKK